MHHRLTACLSHTVFWHTSVAYRLYLTKRLRKMGIVYLSLWGNFARALPHKHTAVFLPNRHRSHHLRFGYFLTCRTKGRPLYLITVCASKLFFFLQLKSVLKKEGVLIEILSRLCVHKFSQIIAFTKCSSDWRSTLSAGLRLAALRFTFVRTARLLGYRSALTSAAERPSCLRIATYLPTSSLRTKEAKN